MKTTWWLLVCALFLVMGASNVSIAGGEDGEVKRLYEEAYRYHTGTGRPQNISKAIELYRAVLRLDPRHINALYNLAGLCALQKRYDFALKYYTRVIRLQPDGNAYNNVGTIYERQGKQKLARMAYEKALQIDPNVAAAHYNLGRLLLEDGETEKALAEVEEALRLEEKALRSRSDSTNYFRYISLYARIKGEAGKISNTIIGLVVAGFVGVLIGYTIFLHKRGTR